MLAMITGRTVSDVLYQTTETHINSGQPWTPRFNHNSNLYFFLFEFTTKGECLSQKLKQLS